MSWVLQPTTLADLGLTGTILNFKWDIDCSANPNYPAATAGDNYFVTVAGKIGWASGPDVEAGDMIICKTTGAAGTHAAAGSRWFIVDAEDPLTLQLLGTLIHNATAKTTPVDADMFGLMDSVAGNIIKKFSWANLKATLKTYFDTLYQAVGSSTTTWENLWSTTLASAANTLTVTLSSSKKYLWIEVNVEQSPDANIDCNLEFNSDTGNNYYWRQNKSGTQTTGTTEAKIQLADNFAYEAFFDLYCTSISDKTKMLTSTWTGSQRTVGAPITFLNSWVWNNTSSQITSVRIWNTINANAKFGVWTKLTVYGHD